jgi:hypothetical protein
MAMFSSHPQVISGVVSSRVFPCITSAGDWSAPIQPQRSYIIVQLNCYAAN